jgi:hypothetical protein
LLALDHARLAIATRRRRWPSDAEHSEKRVVEKRRREMKRESSVHDRGNQRGYTRHPRNDTSRPIQTSFRKLDVNLFTLPSIQT